MNSQCILEGMSNARHWVPPDAAQRGLKVMISRIVRDISPGHERRVHLKMVGAELYPEDFEAPSLRRVGQMTLQFADQLQLFAYSGSTEYNSDKLPETATGKGLDNVAEVQRSLFDDTLDTLGTTEPERFDVATGEDPQRSMICV